jgi:hypothetical protein
MDSGRRDKSTDRTGIKRSAAAIDTPTGRNSVTGSGDKVDGRSDQLFGLKCEPRLAARVFSFLGS